MRGAYRATEQEIESITLLGEEETYDIEMDKEPHNFIANDFISHNSHSVAYGIMGYLTAYLKAHYPDEFYESLFNCYLDDEDAIKSFFREIKNKYEVQPIDINVSEAYFKVKHGKFSIALMSIKGVGEKAALEISANKPYINFKDFKAKTTGRIVNKRVTTPLIKLGAFNNIEKQQDLLNKFEIEKFKLNDAERQYLGYSIKSPVDAIKKRLPEAINLLDVVATLKPKEHSILIAEITEVEIRQDKKKRDYARLELYDGTTVITALMWSHELEKCKDLIKEGQVIVFTGTKSDNEDDDKIFGSDAEDANLIQL